MVEEGQHGDNSIAASSDNEPLRSQEDQSTSSNAERYRNVSSADKPVLDDSSQAFEDSGNTAAFSRDPSASQETPTPSSHLYVGNLFFDTDIATLKREFEKAGEVVRVHIVRDPRGLSKGSVFTRHLGILQHN